MAAYELFAFPVASIKTSLVTVAYEDLHCGSLMLLSCLLYD